LVDKTIKIDHF